MTSPFPSGAVFSVDGQWFTWDDVINDPAGDGWWQACLEVAQDGMARNQAMQHGSGDDADGIAAAVDAAATAFRYEHGLISAEEAEAWLARRGFTIAEWLAALRRRILRSESRYGAPAFAAAEFDACRVERAAWVDAVCSGEAHRQARRMAERIAGAVAAGVVIDRMRDAGHHTAVQGGLEALRARTVTPATVRGAIARHRLEWMRVDGRALDFDDADQAAEAALCVREDGLRLEQVAAAANVCSERIRTFIEEIADPAARSAFISATAGDLVGPFTEGGRHRVVSIDGKTLPSSDDPDIVARAEGSVLAAALRLEAAARVLWLD